MPMLLRVGEDGWPPWIIFMLGTFFAFYYPRVMLSTMFIFVAIIVLDTLYFSGLAAVYGLHEPTMTPSPFT